MWFLAHWRVNNKGVRWRRDTGSYRVGDSFVSPRSHLSHLRLEYISEKESGENRITTGQLSYCEVQQTDVFVFLTFPQSEHPTRTRRKIVPVSEAVQILPPPNSISSSLVSPERRFASLNFKKSVQKCRLTMRQSNPASPVLQLQAERCLPCRTNVLSGREDLSEHQESAYVEPTD